MLVLVDRVEGDEEEEAEAATATEDTEVEAAERMEEGEEATREGGEREEGMDTTAPSRIPAVAIKMEQTKKRERKIRGAGKRGRPPVPEFVVFPLLCWAVLGAELLACIDSCQAYSRLLFLAKRDSDRFLASFSCVLIAFSVSFSILIVRCGWRKCPCVFSLCFPAFFGVP